jgi:REP element-mobilizing transposase RayT
MPNHIHGIFILVGAGLKPAPTTDKKRHGFSEVIRAFKTFSSRKINKLHKTSGTSVWQRNYYERVIRDEDELNKIRQYISDNPIKWELDRENPNAIMIEDKVPWE